MEEYFKGSGPQVLKLWLIGDLLDSSGDSYLPRPEAGSPMLLFLFSQWSDGVVTTGPFGLVAEDNGIVSYARSDGDEAHAAWPVPYFAGMTLE